jgi:hypothetical protein
MKSLLFLGVIALMGVIAVRSGAFSFEGEEKPEEAPRPVFVIQIPPDTESLAPDELVSGEYAIDKEPDGVLIVSAWPAVAVSGKEVMIHEVSLEAVREMYMASDF